MILLVLLLSLQSLQADYYTDEAYEVASVRIDQLPFEGDSLYWAINYISRANYKIGAYKRAYTLAGAVPLDSIGHRFLYFDMLSLRALTAKNVGRLSEADSTYERLFREIPRGYRPIKYRSYLNRAELKRLMMQPDLREQYLLMALAYAGPDEADKVRRVLARHYMNVTLNFGAATMMLKVHTPYDSLEGEERAGYELLVAEVAEKQANYERAKLYYSRAVRTAAQAAFVAIAGQASDGYMRANHLQQQANRQRMYNSLKIMLLIVIILLVLKAMRYEATDA